MRDSPRMSKHQVAVLKVVSAQLSVTAAAAECGISRGHLHRLLRRYREAASTPTRAEVPAATCEPAADFGRRCASGSSPSGLSSPPAAWTPVRPPSPGTWSARAAGPLDLDDPAHPRGRRPRRARAAQAPAQLLDPLRGRRAQRGLAVRLHPLAPRRRERGRDHQLARRPLPLPARLRGLPAGRGDDVVATFTAAGDAHGWPAATLTDNGAVYTSRFTGGRNGFEYLLAYLGIRQKNGSPGHPQTQGKIERFHQTLKRWLGQRPAAADPGRAPGPARRLPGSPTTSSGRTGRLAGSRPARRTGRHPRRSPPAPRRGPLPPPL
jgi:hypothetical protein